MHRTHKLALITAFALIFVPVLAIAQLAPAPTTQLSRAPLNPALPSLFVVGDSTASNGPRNGWGDPIADYFDASRINVRNRALGGRSSRSFISEGHWADVVKELKSGDYVLLQWGQNDGGPLDTGRARGSLPGLGEETREVTMPDKGEIEPPRQAGTKELVHTFGWYLRKYVADVRDKGATPILMSLTAKDIWDNGKNRHPYDKYPEWIAAVAQSEKTAYMDFNKMMGEKFDRMGQAAAHALFPADNTHTNAKGADLNAQGVVAGLKYMNSPLVQYLNDKGMAIDAYQTATTEPVAK